MSFYIIENNESRGPFTIGQLRSMWNAGAINLETKFCREGDAEWKSVKEILLLLEPPKVVEPKEPPVARIVPIMMPPQTEEPAAGFFGKPGTFFRVFNVGCFGILLIVGLLFFLGRGCGENFSSDSLEKIEQQSEGAVDRAIAAGRSSGLVTDTQLRGSTLYITVNESIYNRVAKREREAVFVAFKLKRNFEGEKAYSVVAVSESGSELCRLGK